MSIGTVLGAAKCRNPAIWLAFLLLVPSAAAAASATGAANATREITFVAEIVLLLVTGRLFSEVMTRLGQPPVMGLLLAGILLGHTVFGTIWPSARNAVFPSAPDQKAMLDAVSQLGILMLLLLTGMETDLKLVRKVGRAAIAVSVAGVTVPFLCGFTLGEFLPAFLIPGGNRFVAALFLGTALSISSIKIVAMVVREMNFMRRNLGQIIVASAIMEDSIGWIIIAITLGIADRGQLDLLSLAKTVGGVALFLALSLGPGRRVVFALIRWANDNFRSDFAVVSIILVIMGTMALITAALGVQTVLGAFIAGVLIGESPILTQHIDEQLRGLITAFFMPVFFGLSGMSANLTVLANPQIALLTLGLVLIASLGKFAGAFSGGLIGGLKLPECFALGCGMNARGSTEVIVATIGLSMGALSPTLFTMIVTMAIITTLLMPPMLRRALARIPLEDAERARLEREELDAKGFAAKLERLLLAVDDSPAGRAVSRIAGLVAGGRGMPVTIVDVSKKKSSEMQTQPAEEEAHRREIVAGAKEGAEAAANSPDAEKPPHVDLTRDDKGRTPGEKVATAAQKGFDLLFVGIDKTHNKEGELTPELARIVADFDGPLAVLAGGQKLDPNFLVWNMNILVPVNGTEVARRGAEVAFALALPLHANVTSIYVSQRNAPGGTASRRNEEAVLKDIERLAFRYDVRLRTTVAPHRNTDAPIRREAPKHDLIVMGVSRRGGDTLFFGNTAAQLMRDETGPILFVVS